MQKGWPFVSGEAEKKRPLFRVDFGLASRGENRKRLF